MFLREVFHVVKKHPARVERDAPLDRFANGARLLVNFLKHEMLEAALFRLNWIPGDALSLRHQWIAGEVRDAHAGFCHHGDLSVAKKENVAGVFENRRNIRSDKIFALTDSDYHRRTQARGN